MEIVSTLPPNAWLVLFISGIGITLLSILIQSLWPATLLGFGFNLLSALTASNVGEVIGSITVFYTAFIPLGVFSGVLCIINVLYFIIRLLTLEV